MAGLYFHIPFCRQACNYCDFHFSTLLKEKERVLAAMHLELNQRKNYLSNTPIDTLYFGGGTPSLLESKELGKLIDQSAHLFSVSKDIELTCEVNPDDFEMSTLNSWRALGINRLSIGLQSFNDEELKWMKRKHTAQEALSAVKMAQDAGFENISIDLIYGSKFQDADSWQQTLEQAISMKVQHISAYNLTIEKKTELGVKNTKGIEPELDEQLAVIQFKLLRKNLRQAGFEHYEISNFSLPAFKSRHNSNYWHGEAYLGIGPSAHSFNLSSRSWNVANNNLYCKALENNEKHFEEEILTEKDRYNEYVLTGLRNSRGCDIKWIQKEFGNKAVEYFKKEVGQKLNLIEENNGVYVLTENGMLQADALASNLFML